MKTVIVGVGNPVLRDDGVGIRIADALRTKLDGHPGCDVHEAYAGGLRLMDQMLGYDRALIVDAMWTGTRAPGSILRFGMDELASMRNTSSIHDMDLPTALELARSAGATVPTDIEFWGVEVLDARTFSEDLTEPVAAAAQTVIAEIISLVTGQPERANFREVLV
jgi:hydrogenase maturation protease